MEQFRSGLLADARDAGQVIGGIALEAAIVGELARLETETLADGRDVVTRDVGDAAARRQHRRALADDLQQIEIAGDDEIVSPFGFRARGERRDDVVGLLPFDLGDRNAVRIEHAAHERELTAQILGHRLALRLVLLVQRDAVRGHALVERRDDVRRLLLGDDLVQHHREAVHGIDGHAFHGRERRQREKRAIDEPIRVEQHERVALVGGRARRLCHLS